MGSRGRVITREDLRNAVRRHETLLKNYGFMEEEESLVLQIGSKQNGVSYSINRMRRAGGGLFRSPVGEDFLGWTTPEAYEIVTQRNRVMNDVMDAVAAKAVRDRVQDTCDRCDTAKPVSDLMYYDELPWDFDATGQLRAGKICKRCWMQLELPSC